MTADETGAACDHNPQALTFQSERDFPDESGGDVTVLVHDSVWLWLNIGGGNVRFMDRREGFGGRGEGEDQSGDSNADEHENQSLFS